MTWQDEIAQGQWDEMLERNWRLWHYASDIGDASFASQHYGWWADLIRTNESLHPGNRLEQQRSGEVVWELHRNGVHITRDPETGAISIGKDWRVTRPLRGTGNVLERCEKKRNGYLRTAESYDVSAGRPMRTLISNIVQQRPLTSSLVDLKKSRRANAVLVVYAVLAVVVTLHYKGWIPADLFDRVVAVWGYVQGLLS